MFKINNRRYLGSKFKLLCFIDDIINKHCKNCSSFIDLFAGTGVVAHYFNKKYDVIANDILKSNVFSYETFLSNKKINFKKIELLINSYNNLDTSNISSNYYSENFSNTYLSEVNMRKVGFIRDDIDFNFKKRKINSREKAILVTSLLYAIDKIANTVGHYDAYRKTGDLSKDLHLELPELNDEFNVNNRYTQLDANIFIKKYKADIVYIDPPYNSRQYSDAYHFLENIAVNSKPDVFGVARKMDRTHIKSDYCTTKAAIKFNDLISNISAKYIIVSYNSTGEKINSRSNAKISDNEIVKILETKGKVFIYEKNFNPFTTGKTNLSDHKERLFVCEVGKRNNKKHKVSITNEIIKSPLNYTGGKAKLLPQIKDKLPKKISTFYDVFSGGANVGINIKAEKVYCIDNNSELIKLMKFIQSKTYNELLNEIEDKIQYYNLSNTFVNGYEYYGCNSSKGLVSFNKIGFQKLREDYNKSQNELLFLILIMYSFNNQIRFNKNKEFNLPVGKRDFNSSLRKKLKLFIERLTNRNITFICNDFRNIKIDVLIDEQAFLYLDPPYFLGNASYNENGGWTEKDENDLLNFLEQCNLKGIKFALSNVVLHKGKTHKVLLDWCLKNAFNINYLSYSYANSNYQVKNKNLKSHEVLITNY